MTSTDYTCMLIDQFWERWHSIVIILSSTCNISPSCPFQVAIRYPVLWSSNDISPEENPIAIQLLSGLHVRERIKPVNYNQGVDQTCQLQSGSGSSMSITMIKSGSGSNLSITNREQIKSVKYNQGVDQTYQLQLGSRSYPSITIRERIKPVNVQWSNLGMDQTHQLQWLNLVVYHTSQWSNQGADQTRQLELSSQRVIKLLNYIVVMWLTCWCRWRFKLVCILSWS